MKLDIEKNSSADYISARIKSTILYPKVTKTEKELCRDEEHAEGRERAFWAFYVSYLSDEKISKIVKPRIVRFLNECKPLSFYTNAWEARKQEMYTVHSLMSLVYSGTHYQRQPISLGAAVDKYVERAQTEYVLAPKIANLNIFSEEACSELRAIPADRNKNRLVDSSVKNHWRALKEVAHLCAAWYAIKPNMAESDSERFDNLMDVLDIAKGLYDFGVNHVVPRSQKALLAPETTWSIPDCPGMIGHWSKEEFLLNLADYEYYPFNHLSVESFEGLD